MRVLRVGGRYLAQRERRLWLALAGVIAAPVAPAVLGHPEIAAAVGLAACIVGARVGRRLRHVRHGRLGERIVTSALRRLPDDYILINDVMLARGRGNVDHVLIGPCGVVAIETKRLAGHIRCDGDAWWINGYSRRSISRQVNAGAGVLQRSLVKHHPDLEGSALRWVESIVVFTHPLCRLDVHHSRTIVVRFSELLTAVLAVTDRKRVPPAVVERLALTLRSMEDR